MISVFVRVCVCVGGVTGKALLKLDVVVFALQVPMSLPVCVRICVRGGVRGAVTGAAEVYGVAAMRRSAARCNIS